jgi:hypothetical protein
MIRPLWKGDDVGNLAIEIAKVEKNIAGLAHEEAYGWSATETFMDHVVGNAYEVKWSNADMLKIINGVITHNHPRPSLPCPSLEDLMFMRKNYLKELRVVSKDLFKWHGVAHRVCTRKGLTWPTFEEKVFIDQMKAIYAAHHIAVYEDGLGNKIHPREIIKASIDATDVALTMLGEKWGFNYRAWTD